MRKRLFAALLLLLPLAALASDSSLGILSPLHFSPPSSDLSMYYLSMIFGSVGGLLSGGGSQIMGKMFAVFNAAALAFGGLLLAYLFLMGTLNTAHEGELLGKRYSSIWIPVRAVLGCALLIPKATGYSIIQVIVMWVVIQGIGAADSTWNAAVNYLQKGGTIISATTQPTAAGKEQLTKLPGNTMKMLVCVANLQHYINKAQGGTNYVNFFNAIQPMKLGSLTNPHTGQIKPVNQAHVPMLNGNSPYADLDNLCGTMSWNTNLKGGTEKNSKSALTLAKARTLAYQEMFSSLQSQAELVAPNYDKAESGSPDALPYGSCPVDGKKDSGRMKACGPGSSTAWFNGNTNTLFDTNGSLLYKTYSTYNSQMSAVRQTVNTELSASNVDASHGPTIKGSGIGSSTTHFSDMKKQGWISAGEYYFDLVAMNHNITKSLGDPPQVTYNLKKEVDNAGGADKFCRQSKYSSLFGGTSTCEDFVNASLSGPDIGNIPSGYPSNTILNYINSASAYQPQGIDRGPTGDASFHGRLWGLDAFFTARLIIMGVASSGSGTASPVVWTMVGIGIAMVNTLAADMQEMHDTLLGPTHSNNYVSGGNPLLWLARLGNDMMDYAGLIWLTGLGFAISAFVSGLVPSVNMAEAAVAAATWLAPIVTAIVAMLFAGGMVLAVYLPFIPFIIFTLAAIGWMIAVIESMVAAPLVALGLIWPEGHEVFGKSEQAMMLLLNVFLRPSMMVIGLVAGISLSYAGVWLFSQGFWYVCSIVNSSFNPGGFAFIFLGSLVIYVTSVMAVIQKSCELIYLVPDKVTRWLSGGMAESFGSDSAREGVQAVRGASSQFGSQMGNAIGQSSSNTMKSLADKNKAEGDKAKGTEKTDAAAKDSGAKIESDAS